MALATIVACSAAAREVVSLCAEVRLEIRQELTTERQAFDARMRIGNGLPALAIENAEIDLVFTDDRGDEVEVTSDPNNTNAVFFVRVDTLDGISDVQGAGRVEPATEAEIHWLIIPSPGAAGSSPLGRRYEVGATVHYTLGGEPERVEVVPDSIVVRPTPLLQLDYFLPEDVYSDDAFTPEVEPPIPFSLGVRVRNSGHGPANKLKIDTGQPRIVENELGLLISFVITGTEVNGVTAANTLLADFGAVGPGRAGVARWIMETTLSGEFTEFAASFSHSDELGGQLTSLIDGVAAHRIVRDVLVDLPGRDAVRDFLARDGAALKVYESDNIDTAVTDRSAASAWALTGQSGLRRTYQLSVPATSGPLYVAKTNDLGDAQGLAVVSAIRSDGKSLRLDNAWISKSRESGNDPWAYAFHLFDVNGGGTYAVVMEGEVQVPRPPVLGFVGRKVTFVGTPLGFLVEATDPNDTIPALTTTLLPQGSTFTVTNRGLAAEGAFTWTPEAGQEGVYPVIFTASDGGLSDAEMVKIYAGRSGEAVDAQGIPESLTNWGPDIVEVAAASAQPGAIVRWNSVPGIPYSVYYSDLAFSPSMTWQSLTSSVQAQAGVEQVFDASLATGRMSRFYQVEVAGDAPNLGGVWGVIRKSIPAASYTMAAAPLRMDRRFDGALGDALAEVLDGDDGGGGDMAGDEIYIRESNGVWRTLYLDASRVWREAGGAASTYELPPGHGFFVARHQVAPARITFTGRVGNDGSQTNAVHPGWNILSFSEGRASAPAALLAAASNGGPVGSIVEEAADLLVLQRPDGAWQRLAHVEGWGPPYDGTWVDLDTGAVTNPQLEPGQSFYYFRQESAGPMNVTF